MRVLNIVTILLLSAVKLTAGDIARKGTAGAEQLLIPVGGRSIATAGAFVSSMTGVEAIYYNPAGLAGTTTNEALFSYMSYVADINVAYLAVGFGAGDIGSFGISFKSLDFGDIPETTVDLPDGTGSTYSPVYFVAAATYSRNITDRVRAGINFKYINEQIVSTRAQGIAFDFGVQYKFVGNLSLGVTLKNIGGNMVYSGQALQVRTSIPGGNPTSVGTGIYEPAIEPFQLPSTFEMSLSYALDMGGRNSLALGTTYKSNSSQEDQMIIGTEFRALDFLHLRAGYDLYAQNQSASQFGLNYGGGIEYSFEGYAISVDYAYRSFKDFAGNQVLSVKFGF